MRPAATQPGPDNGADTDRDEFNTWLALKRSTDKQRANLIADIVGHPQGAPSVTELDHMNPSLEEDAIRRHLSILQDVGVVEELVVQPGERVRGYPYKFYALTSEARGLFDQNDLFPIEPWQRQYSRVQKPSEIREVEQMPRPDPD